MDLIRRLFCTRSGRRVDESGGWRFGPVLGAGPAVAGKSDFTAALVAAIGEAGRLGHGWVGTEHLLLGLLGAPQDRGGAALAALGCPDLATARAAVAARIGPGRDPGGHLPWTPRARKVLAAARRPAGPPDSGDLLVAVAGDGGLGTALLAEWVVAAAVRPARVGD